MQKSMEATLLSQSIPIGSRVRPSAVTVRRRLQVAVSEINLDFLLAESDPDQASKGLELEALRQLPNTQLTIDNIRWREAILAVYRYLWVGSNPTSIYPLLRDCWLASI